MNNNFKLGGGWVGGRVVGWVGEWVGGFMYIIKPLRGPTCKLRFASWNTT